MIHFHVHSTVGCTVHFWWFKTYFNKLTALIIIILTEFQLKIIRKSSMVYSIDEREKATDALATATASAATPAEPYRFRVAVGTMRRAGSGVWDGCVTWRHGRQPTVPPPSLWPSSPNTGAGLRRRVVRTPRGRLVRSAGRWWLWRCQQYRPICQVSDALSRRRTTLPAVRQCLRWPYADVAIVLAQSVLRPKSQCWVSVAPSTSCAQISSQPYGGRAVGQRAKRRVRRRWSGPANRQQFQSKRLKKIFFIHKLLQLFLT